MATIVTASPTSEVGTQNWAVTGAVPVLGDASDATYWRHTNSISYLSHQLSGSFASHTKPANHELHRVRLCGRIRTHSGGTAAAAWAGIYWDGASYVADEGVFAATGTWGERDWAWQTIEHNLTGAPTYIFGPVGNRFDEYSLPFDVAKLWIEYDYRVAPSFTVSASVSASKATVSAASLNLDGLPARSWTLAITGPTNWSTSGSGAYAPVTTPDLANGSYSVSLTIRSTVRTDTALTTTRTGSFVINRPKPTFNVSASAGITKKATITATSINLDGLPARSWSVNVTGPTPWSTSGSGAWPGGGVQTPDLSNGSYSVSVTIAATHFGAAWSTTKTASFTVDFRNRPSFNVAASAGITKKATVTATAIDLDGLPARSWSVNVTGPTNWSTSGSGAYAPVTTPDLANGSYSVSLTINATNGGAAYGTTKTASFVVDYRNPPAFTVSASAGITRYATVTVTGVNLSGLPARDWTLAITGPQTWSASGSGAYPGAVTSGELVNGSYSVSVTIRATHQGQPYGTTKATTFTVASDDTFTLLCDTEYESSLAGHFDLACNSIGATWWCDREGVIQFAQEPPGNAAWTFTDDPAGSGVKYTDLAMAYDSRNLVNTLTATNKPIPDEIRHTYHDPTSVAMWGSRSDSVDLSVYDVGGTLARRTKALVDKFKTLALLPSRLTFNAATYPAAAAGLEQYQRVNVEYRGNAYSALVVGIEHEIEPEEWFVTIHLMKD